MAVLRNVSDSSLIVGGIEVIGEDVDVKKTNLAVFSQRLSQINTQFTTNQIKKIISDSVVNQVEKRYLKSLMDSITASYNIATSDCENINIISGETYIAYKASYDSLKALLDVILEDMTTISAVNGTTLQTLVENYYTNSDTMATTINTITYSMSEEAKENAKNSIFIDCDSQYLSKDETLTLTARIMREGVNKTDDYNASCFDWVIEGTNDDTLWNNQHKGLKSITVPYSVIADSSVLVSVSFSFFSS